MTARYSQCHGDCTVDCGHCKGNGRPAEACIYCGRPHLGVELPDCPQPPAEAQQDDEREALRQERVEVARRLVDAVRHSDDPVRYVASVLTARADLAARPSADTETLRARIEKLARQYQRLSEELHLVPAADAFHDAALDLRRALDGDR